MSGSKKKASHAKKSAKGDKTGKYIITAVALIAIAAAVVLFARGCRKEETAEDNTAADNTQAVTQQPEETIEQAEEKTQNPVVLEDKKESSYERWLAAAAVMGIMMDEEDPDYNIESIFLTGETAMDDYLSSQGIYIVLSDSEGTKYIYCRPLESERIETGTTDIKSADLGWATFDYVENPDLTGCTEISTDEIEEEISQSMLVTLSRH